MKGLINQYRPLEQMTKPKVEKKNLETPEGGISFFCVCVFLFQSVFIMFYYYKHFISCHSVQGCKDTKKIHNSAKQNKK